MTFTIGTDPELFPVNRRTNKPVAALGLVNGTKEAPQKIEAGAVQVDGMALEINTDPVVMSDFAAFRGNILKVRKALVDMLPENVRLDTKPVQEFDPEFLASLPAEATDLGCNPDYNAYTLKPNPRPDVEKPFRTGAGHIHVGWASGIPVEDETHINICAAAVKALDVYAGLYSVIIDPDQRRRELYGKAGAFRPKPYGVEYRVPSNVWLVSKATMYVMHCCVNQAIGSLMSSQGDLDSLFKYLERHYKIVLTEEHIQEVINTGNTARATEIFTRITDIAPIGYRYKNKVLVENFEKSLADVANYRKKFNKE